MTGDLRLVVGKSDAFDENSQPVKVGILRLRFDPEHFHRSHTDDDCDAQVRAWVPSGAPPRCVRRARARAVGSLCPPPSP